jgi:hypothetical protein
MESTYPCQWLCRSGIGSSVRPFLIQVGPNRAQLLEKFIAFLNVRSVLFQNFRHKAGEISGLDGEHAILNRLCETVVFFIMGK